MNLILQLEHLVNVLKSEVTNRQKDYINIIDEVHIEDKRIKNPYKAMLVMARTYQLEKFPVDQEKKTTDILDSFQYAIDKTKAKYPEYQDIASITLHVQCPCCGYVKKNALLMHKNVVIRCPKCNKIFYWNASDEKNTYIEEIRQKKDQEQSVKRKQNSNNPIINKIRLFFETWRLNLKIR